MSGKGEIRIREAAREDVPLLFGLIRELADYEKLTAAVRGNEELLAESLFERRAADALIAEAGEEVAGYAMYFTTFSTFECLPGLWVEDIFVRPALRGRGIGRALLAEIASIAVERGYPRVEWVALDWNEPALGFYDRLGARRLDDWKTLRLEGEPLRELGGAP